MTYQPGTYAASRAAPLPAAPPAAPAPRPVAAKSTGYQPGSYAANRAAGVTPPLSSLVGAAKPSSVAGGGGGGGGWWENLVSSPLHTALALGPGLAHLAGKAAQTAGKVGWEAATAPIAIGRVIAGNQDPSALLRPAAALNLPAQIAGAVAPAIDEVTGHEPSVLTPFRQALEQTAPVSAEFSQSAGRTAGRVTHPSRYVEAWRQGQAFPAALEDVANLSMLGDAVGSGLSGELVQGARPLTAAGEAAEGPAAFVRSGPAPGLGARISEIAHLGEQAAGGIAKPYGWALKGLGKGVELAGRGTPAEIVGRAAESLTAPRDPTAPRPSPLSRSLSRLAFKMTPQGQEFRSIMGTSVNNQFDALRKAGEASTLAQKLKAAPEESMAAVLLADERLAPLERLYGTADPEVWNKTIHDVFAAVPEYQRPTPGAVRLAIEAKAIREGTVLPESIGGPTEAQMKNINQIYDSLSGVAGRATEAAKAGQGWVGEGAALNPEHLGTEPLSAAAEKLRQPLEARRETLTAQWNRQAEQATRDRRIADAHTAAFAEIRPGVTPSAMFARGKAAGKLVADEKAATTAARAAQSTLAKSVSDYAAAVQRGDANVGTLAANVDALTAKANDALAEVGRAQRELQARRGLRTASGQAVPAETPEALGAAAPLGAEIPLTAGTAPATPAIERQIGGAEERVRGAQRLAAIARRALGRGETAATNAATEAYGPAPASVSAALGRAESGATLAEEAAARAQERSATGQEMLRPTMPAAAGTAEATRLPESRALSTAQQLGRLNERARASAAIERTTRRAIDSANAKIAAIPETLRQAFPERLVKLNDNFVAAARGAAARIERAGTAAPGISDMLNTSIDEILAEHGNTPGARFVIPRMIRDVFDSVEGLPDDVRSQLDARLQAWEKARATMMSKVADIQFQGSPGPFRSPMTTARLGFKSLMDQADAKETAGDVAGAQMLRQYAEDIPSTVEAMDKAGIKPTFLTGGEAGNVPKPTGRISLNQRKVAAQYQRKGGFGAAALDDVSRRQMQQAKLIVENQTRAELTKAFGRQADSLVEDAGTLTPEELSRAVRAQGYVPLKGDITAHDTMVVPEYIAKEAGKYERQLDDNFFYHLLSRANSGWKTGILALSPRWHMGNIAGNAMMAMVYGGIGPAELVSRLNDIRKEGGGLKELYRSGGAVEGRPSELLRQGVTRSEHELMQQGGPGAAKQMGRIGRLAEHSYRANEFADAMFRTAVYDSKLGQGVPSAAALRQTLNAMGDFSRMTNFERVWVRQALPFYPWLRHQTQAIMRLPLEHPARAIWMGHLANMMTDPTMSNQDLRLLGMRLPTPWGGLNLSTLNPFGDPTRMPLIDPTAFGQAISPALKLPAAIAGLDIAHQPPGQFARPGRQTGMLSPGELAYYVSQQVPFVSTATNLALNPSIARYKTGQAIPSQEGIPTGRGYLSTLMQGLGVPWPDQSVTPQKLAAQKAARGG